MNTITNIAQSIAIEHNLQVRRLIIEQHFNADGNFCEFRGYLTVCDDKDNSKSRKFFTIYESGLFIEQEYDS